MPVFRWCNLFGSLVEYTEQMKTITDLPLLFVYLRESQRLVSQDFRDVDELALPLDLPVVAHLPHRDSRVVLNRREFDWITPWGTMIDTPGGLSSQRLMGALPVVLLHKRIELALLRSERRLWRGHGRVLQRAVQTLMASILRRFARPDALGLDPELNPPLRQLADATHCQRGKRGPVIGADGLGQAVFSKHPFTPRPHRLGAGPLKPSALQQIPRVVVAQRQRITAPTVPQLKLPLEVRTPALTVLSAGQPLSACALRNLSITFFGPQL